MGSMFNNVGGGVYIAGGNFAVSTPSSLQSAPDHGHELKGLLKHVVVDAFHDSATSHDLPKCYPGTRVAIMKDLRHWVTDMNHEYPIYHLYAPAGSGKTAIARTLADTFSGLNHLFSKHLLANFFFSRTVQGRNSTANFITTLAYQVAINLPLAQPFVQEAIDQDPFLPSRNLSTQLNSLILNPLRQACQQATEQGQTTSSWPRLIVLDGLDECSGEDAQINILDAVTELAKSRSFPLAIFLSCRPEPHIRSAFRTGLLNKLSQQICLSNQYESERDIRLFLVNTFKDIRKAHSRIQEIPQDWPDSETIEVLVKKSSGHFIYASVVIKYVKALDDNPIDRLKVVRGLAEIRDDEKPFAQLDTLYLHILDSVKPRHRPVVMDVLRFILALECPVPACILPFDEATLSYGVAGLNGILIQFTGNNLTFLHASFSDFLLQRNRAGEHYVDLGQARVTIGILLFNNFVNPRHVTGRKVIPNHIQTILCGLAESHDHEKPFALLDTLYLHILDSFKARHRPVVMDVLRFILALKDRVPTCILPFDGATSKYGVAGLNDILIHTSNNLTSFNHASLCDFLLQRSRAGQYCVDLDQARAAVAILLFDNLTNPCHMTYYGDFILKHLQSILPRSSPTPALHLKIKSVAEHDKATKIIKVNIKAGHWDVVMNLPIILGTSPFSNAHSLETSLQPILHAYIYSEVKKYADEPLCYMVALFMAREKINLQGAVFSYLWPTIGIDMEIDTNSLNIWSMFFERSDVVFSVRDIIGTGLTRLDQNVYRSTCIKLVEGMIEDPEYSRNRHLILGLLWNVVKPLLQFAGPSEELSECLRRFKHSPWWYDCITAGCQLGDTSKLLDSYLLVCFLLLRAGLQSN